MIREVHRVVDVVCFHAPSRFLTSILVAGRVVRGVCCRPGGGKYTFWQGGTLGQAFVAGGVVPAHLANTTYVPLCSGCPRCQPGTGIVRVLRVDENVPYQVGTRKVPDVCVCRRMHLIKGPNTNGEGKFEK